MSSSILELEKEYRIKCEKEEDNLFDLNIDNIETEDKVISFKLDKLDVITLINDILKVYSIYLKKEKDVFIETNIINKFDLGYNMENDFLIFYIKENNKTLKLTSKDLLSLSIMLSSSLI